MAPALLLLGLGAIAQAAPDLSSSLTFSPATPFAGDVIRYVLHVRNSGDADLNYVEVRVDAPEASHLIAARGLSDAFLESDERRVSGHVTVAAGAVVPVEVDVLTPRNAGGLSLSLRARVASSEHQLEHWDAATVQLDQRFDEGGVNVGGLRLLPAALAVLGSLLTAGVVFAALTFLAWRRTGSPWRFEPALATLAFLFSGGLWTFYGAMALRDYRILTSFEETTASILGRRLDSASSPGTSSGGRSTADRSTYTPELALRYEAKGVTTFSTGYDSGSALRFGGRAAREKELEGWSLGATVPAWYDPTAPLDVVVKRGFGGAYVFALLGLLPFALGLWLLGRLLRSKQPETP